MASVGLSIWLALNFLAVVVISKKNVAIGILPNLALATFVMIYIIPILFNPQVSDYFLASVLISNVVFLAFFLLASISKANHFDKVRGLENRKTLSIGGLSVVIAVFFCVAGNAATYYSLINSGGLLAVISDYGGRGYLSVRVNNESSGILGVLAWSSPFSLSFLFAAALTRRRKSYWIWFFLFFIMTALGYGLLTVRHNMVATLMMLLLTFLTFRKMSPTVLVGFIAASLSVLVFFQSLRVGGIEGLALNAALDTTVAANEHIWVTEHVIEETNSTGFTFFSHATDIFIFAIPRAIWPSKPETSTLNRIFFPDVAAVGSEKAIGLIGEGYASLGLLGVALITSTFAFAISRLQRHLNRVWSAPTTAFIAIAFIPLCYIGVRTGFLGKHLISFLLIYMQYVILTRTSKYKLVLRAH